MVRAWCSAFPAQAPKARLCASIWSAIEPDATRQDIPAQEALQPLIALAEAVARIRHFTGMNQPTVTT